MSSQELLDNPHALIGSVAAVCERLQQLRAEHGISYIDVAQRNMAEFAPVVAALADT